MYIHPSTREQAARKGLPCLEFRGFVVECRCLGQRAFEFEAPGRHLRQVAPDQLLTNLQFAAPWASTDSNPADAPTRGHAVRRAPLERSELAESLLSRAFDERTEAAFLSYARHGAPVSVLLEPVTGPPYSTGRREEHAGFLRMDVYRAKSISANAFVCSMASLGKNGP